MKYIGIFTTSFDMTVEANSFEEARDILLDFTCQEVLEQQSDMELSLDMIMEEE